MIFGRYNVSGIGWCEIKSNRTEFNPEGILAFKLVELQTDEEVGRFGLGYEAGKEGVPNEAFQLTGLGVKSDFRGRGAGSFLVGKALGYAREARGRSFSAWAVNERVVSSIRSNLAGSEELSVRILASRDGVNAQASADDAIRYLQEQRERQFSAEDDPDGARMLSTVALPVYVEVPLI